LNVNWIMPIQDVDHAIGHCVVRVHGDENATPAHCFAVLLGCLLVQPQSNEGSRQAPGHTAGTGAYEGGSQWAGGKYRTDAGYQRCGDTHKQTADATDQRALARVETLFFSTGRSATFRVRKRIRSHDTYLLALNAHRNQIPHSLTGIVDAVIEGGYHGWHLSKLITPGGVTPLFGGRLVFLRFRRKTGFHRNWLQKGLMWKFAWYCAADFRQPALLAEVWFSRSASPHVAEV
jgi:hypothetical protein